MSIWSSRFCPLELPVLFGAGVLVVGGRSPLFIASVPACRALSPACEAGL